MKAANSAHVNWGIPPIYLVEGKWADKNPWEDESVPNNAIKWGEVCRITALDRHLGLL